jgi:nucleoside-diphosphate kinase
MIKPDAYNNTGKIIDAIYQSGFKISKLKMSKFNTNSVASFYGEHKGKPFYNDLSTFIQSDVSTGIELIAENAVEKWR